MGIWNEIQKQIEELEDLMKEAKRIDEIYNQIKSNDRKTI
tara:strand:+ start:1009 stop:1128 length:120 start_codon:yes stop_codon:yes gene_type:complete